MNILGIITLFIFVTSFISYFVVGIVMSFTKRSLRLRLEKQFSKELIKKPQSHFFVDYNYVWKTFKFLLRFGSKANVRELNSHYFNITLVEELKDISINKLLTRWFWLTSIFGKLWIVCLGSLVLIGIEIGFTK